VQPMPELSADHVHIALDDDNRVVYFVGDSGGYLAYDCRFSRHD